MQKDSTSRLLDLFADLLEYPTLATPLKAGLCYEQLREVQPAAGNLLASFYDEMEKRTLKQMQEIYTSTFDMQPVCYPYVGYQLFGESYKRGAFMAHLNEAYHGCGFFVEKELPDHISIVLRFLGLDITKREDDFGGTLLHEGLVPALKKMGGTLEKQVDNPYASVLFALLCVLTDAPEKEVEHA